MCFETMNEAAARACKERDALRKKTAEQEKEILSLKEELQQARSILTEKYEETLELLEAAKSAQGLLQIHLVKVQEERDALEKALKSCEGCCAVCVHENDRPDCDGNCTGCKAKCHCYTCSRENENFVWVGLEAEHG